MELLGNIVRVLKELELWKSFIASVFIVGGTGAAIILYQIMYKTIGSYLKKKFSKGGTK